MNISKLITKVFPLALITVLLTVISMIHIVKAQMVTEPSVNYDHVDPSYGEGVFGGEPTNQINPSDLLDVNKASDTQISTYDAFFKENQKRHLQDVADLIAFPTLAMDPSQAETLVDAGKFLKEKLTSIGFQNTTIHPADGFPLITAEWMKAKGQPTVLFYGHYDVQPANPSRWDSDPFVAEIRDGKMYGRGATDNKAGIIALMSTVEAMLEKDGSLPVNVKVFFDGAEEFGSQTMPAWLGEPTNNQWIRTADYGFNLDAMMFSDDRGQMWKGLKGSGEVVVKLTSANTALHSGIFGGNAPNAAIAASKIIDSMWDDNGVVTIKGFYDDAKPITKAQKEEVAAIEAQADPDAIRKKNGVAQWLPGESEYTQLERAWLRPSLDVTGFKSGYTEGSASVIPDSAWFRVMTRTVNGQDPNKLNEQIMAHIEKNVPWGIQVEMTSGSGGGAAVFDENDLGFKIGETVLTNVFGQSPVILYVGGGVPALSYVPDAGGPKLVSFGFQRSDEGFHADNEYMRISSFETSQRAYTQLLHALVGQPRTKTQ